MIAPGRGRYTAPTEFTDPRRTAAEYLDDPSLSAEDRAESYRDLERFDRWPFQYGPLEAGVLRLARGAAARPIELLELGAGTGHTGRRLAASLRRRGIDVRLHLTDRSTEFLEATAGGNDRVSRIDWLADPLPSADIVVANLVLHHFETGAAVMALSKAAGSARVGGVIHDLNRHSMAFQALRLALPLIARSPITLADGLISVQQAFTRDELAELARAAGIARPEVSTHGLLRNRLIWRSRSGAEGSS